MLPLVSLRFPPVPARVGVYPDADLAWDDRDELVVGGCKPGAVAETTCYDGWNTALTSRILENPSANTVVLLSTGAGVLELRALKLALDLRGDVGRAINQVWLIDPYLDTETGDQVASHYAAHLPDVDVTYFTGEGAYDEALALHARSSNVVTAVVGALNMSLGALSTHPTSVARNERVLQLLALIEAEQRSGFPLHVVQAFHNDQEGHVVRDELSTDFAARRRGLLAMLRGLR